MGKSWIILNQWATRRGYSSRNDIIMLGWRHETHTPEWGTEIAYPIRCSMRVLMRVPPQGMRGLAGQPMCLYSIGT